MTAVALQGQPQPRQGDDQRDASRDKLASSIESLCPDERVVYDAIRAAGSYISPSRLHAIYEHVTANADVDFDFGAHVITYLTRHGSRPADLATGEKAVHHLMRKERS